MLDLIVTLMCAATITVPGQVGNNQNTDLSMFFSEKLFMLFLISDVLLHSNHDDNPCASLFIILLGKSRIVIPLIFLSGVAVVVFIWMQFGLLIDMVNITYRPGILDMKVKPES